jgi:hypothetical protein
LREGFAGVGSKPQSEILVYLSIATLHILHYLLERGHPRGGEVAVLQDDPSTGLHVGFYQSLSNNSLSLAQAHTLQFYLLGLAEVAYSHEGVSAW